MVNKLDEHLLAPVTFPFNRIHKSIPAIKSTTIGRLTDGERRLVYCIAGWEQEQQPTVLCKVTWWLAASFSATIPTDQR